MMQLDVFVISWLLRAFLGGLYGWLQKARFYVAKNGRYLTMEDSKTVKYDQSTKPRKQKGWGFIFPFYARTVIHRIAIYMSL